MGVSVFPVPSVALTISFAGPAPFGVQAYDQRRHESGPIGVSRVARPHDFAPSLESSTFEIPRAPANAIPATVIASPVQRTLRPGRSIRAFVLMFALSDQPCCCQ